MKRDRPNLVIILTDQQRGDCLGIEGRKGLLTPNLDCLAASGVRFTRAYSTCPTCIAARRSLMSGQKPATHRMVGFRAHQEWHIEHTLPAELRRAGYQTAIVGRDMHLHPPRKRYGFDQMITTNHDYRRWLDEHSSPWQGRNRGHGVRDAFWMTRPWHLPEWQHETNWTIEEALRFLDGRDPSCPFFLIVSFYPPHPPLTPPAFYLDRYLRADLPDPVVGDWATPPEKTDLLNPGSFYMQAPSEAARLFCAGYYALINHIDDQIARFLPRVRKEAPNTYILFTSDHGEMMGDHYWRHKGLPYEGAARIPLLLSGPEIPPALTCDKPVCLEDVMPTLLDVAGLPTPTTVEGRSLVPLSGGLTADWRVYLHGEHAHDAGWYEFGGVGHPPRITGMHYLTDGKDKYIWFTGNGREQLFDLLSDPTECRDLAGKPEHASRLALWRERLIEELQDRPEGFTDGKQLIAGRPYGAMLPHAHGNAPE